MNALVAQALLRFLHTVEGSLLQSPEAVKADLEFLLFKCKLANGITPNIDVDAIIAALVTT